MAEARLDPPEIAGPQGLPGPAGPKGDTGNPGPAGVDVGAPTAWTDIVYSAGHTDLDQAAYGKSGWRKEGDVVRLRGVPTKATVYTSGEAICTLPVAARPAIKQVLPCQIANGAATYIIVDTNGVLSVNWSGGTVSGTMFTTLSGITYPTT